ncbi:P-loop containing nucleoside triphosphate hydrolase protein [Xylaria scruposa]|nr:P-loop containing nucleoside triphosphate hydrolase protein [Xylaria scruposa]
MIHQDDPFESLVELFELRKFSIIDTISKYNSSDGGSAFKSSPDPTITIAHRLSTIKNADNIAVMSKGSILRVLKLEGQHQFKEDKRQVQDKCETLYNPEAMTTWWLERALLYPPYPPPPNGTTTAPPRRDIDFQKSQPLVRFREAILSRILILISCIMTNPIDGLKSGLPTYALKTPLLETLFNAIRLNVTRCLPTPEGYQEKEVQYGFWTLVRFVPRFNKQEWMLMIWGLFWAIVCGSSNPVHACLFAKQVLIPSVPILSNNRHEVKNRSDLWSLMVRDQAFRTMRHDVSFDENTTGALTSFLTTEATHVAGLSGATLRTLLTVVTTLVSSIAVALIFGWKLALVCTANVPKRPKRAYKRSASYASEAISSIEPYSLTNAGSQCYTTLQTGSRVAAKIQSDFSSRIVTPICRVGIIPPPRPRPRIPSQDSKGKVQAIQGAIQLCDVHFQYPTRPDPVLSGLSLTVQPNQYVALRFYDPSSGTIYVDGKDIRGLDVNNYRSFVPLVSQEPMIYKETNKGNILLGTSNNVPDHDVESACREANIYDFILLLPDAFNTIVGSEGVLRNPGILLLDEATALDSESEHVVQAALENASRGRTTIAVAHRLSTVNRADIIYVFDLGRIVEQDSHSGLMRRRNGRYAELVRY